MTSQRSHEDTNWRAALEEYRAAKDRAAGAFRPDAKTCADLLARVAGVVRKGRSSPAGHDDATQRAAAAREIVDAPRGTWFLGADAAARQTSGGGRKGAATSDVRAGGRPGAVGRRDDGGDVRALARACAAPGTRTPHCARARAAHAAVRRARTRLCCLRAAGRRDRRSRSRATAGGRRPGRGGPCGAPRLRGRRGAARPRPDRSPRTRATCPSRPRPSPRGAPRQRRARGAVPGSARRRRERACGACGATPARGRAAARQRSRRASRASRPVRAARWAAFERWLRAVWRILRRPS